MILAGFMVLLLLLTRGTLADTRQSQWIVFVSIVALFATQTAGNVLIWRASDELLRGQMLQAGAITFAIGQGAVFLWTATERLHLAPPVTSWQVTTVMLTLYLITSAEIALRNRPGF